MIADAARSSLRQPIPAALTGRLALLASRLMFGHLNPTRAGVGPRARQGITLTSPAPDGEGA